MLYGILPQIGLQQLWCGEYDFNSASICQIIFMATLLWQFNIVLFSVFSGYCGGFFSLMKRSKYLIIQLVFRRYTDGARNHIKWLFGVGLYGELAIHIAQALWMSF